MYTNARAVSVLEKNRFIVLKNYAILKFIVWLMVLVALLAHTVGKAVEKAGRWSGVGGKQELQNDFKQIKTPFFRPSRSRFAFFQCVRIKNTNLKMDSLDHATPLAEWHPDPVHCQPTDGDQSAIVSRVASVQAKRERKNG